MGHAVQDARDAPIGTFAGTTTADAQTVGSYGNVAHSGREAMGTFAGDPDKQRRGSFGDSDRDTVTTYQAGLKRTRIASHRRLKKILVDAGLDQATAAADVDALHAGRVLVLVHSDVGAGRHRGRDRRPRPLAARRLRRGCSHRCCLTHVLQRNSHATSLAIASSAAERPPASR